MWSSLSNDITLIQICVSHPSLLLFEYFIGLDFIVPYLLYLSILNNLWTDIMEAVKHSALSLINF